MRNLILVVSILFVIVSCRKEDDSQSNNGKIVIKGIISGTKTTKSTGLKSTNELSLSNAKKVLVFNSNEYHLFDIKDSSFLAKASSGTATALAFLDAENRYIGCLCSGGLNVLPLVSLKDGDKTVIDLSTLTLDGTSVIPANNPIGDAINLDEGEIARYKELGAYYESLSKNIDANNDGIPDILDQKQLIIRSLFTTQGGHWGHNDTKPSVTDTSQFFMNYMIHIDGGNGLTFSNGDISFSGPEEDPYNDITLHGFRMTPDGPQGFLSTFKREINPPDPGTPFWNVLKPFKKGTYSLTLDGNRHYSLNFSNINCKYYMVLVIPTLHTNNEGKLVSISLEYKLPDNVTTIDPVNILTDLMVHLGNPDEFYHSPWLSVKTGFTEIKLSTPLDISSLHHIDIFYDDLVGNEYDIIWQ
jgi:hypothetical protein